MTLKPCPNCKCPVLEDRYIYIQCPKCLMQGPMMNGGRNDDHADNMDHQAAMRAWNSLPRRGDENIELFD